MRPKKTPGRRGVLLKEQPFTFRQRQDGSVAIFWNRRPATVLTGKLAENFLAAAPGCPGQELQLLMATAAGSFKRGRRDRIEPIHDAYMEAVLDRAQEALA